ncbi:MAG: methyltransferase domain-containing protein [Deltaproteobacteria bacterium]|nr:methyltransferase domain-containing protein [Deltaproteobacteria bacterium]
MIKNTLTSPDDDIVNVTTGRPPAYVVHDLLHLQDIFGDHLELLRGRRVLDIGSGTTEMARYLHEEYGISRAKQLDWWYDANRHKLRRLVCVTHTKKDILHWIKKNTRYLISGTVNDTTVGDSTQDLVTSSHLLRHFEKREELEKAFLEIYRILKPGGMAVIVPIHRGKVKLITSLLEAYQINHEWIPITPEYKIEGRQFRLIITK